MIQLEVNVYPTDYEEPWGDLRVCVPCSIQWYGGYCQEGSVQSLCPECEKQATYTVKQDV